jgi:hypothetical protein
MQTATQSWTPHLLNEFDRYVATLIVREGARYRCAITGTSISKEQLAQVRNEVIANATTDSTSLAYHMLLESGPNAHTSDPCLTCDAAVRLAWGASATRRELGLPPSRDIASDANADRAAS